MPDEPVKPEGEVKPDSKDGGDPSAERPGWLPEKFKSPEDLAKAYGELEKKMSKGEHKKPASDTLSLGTPTPEVPDYDVPELLDKAGLKLEEVAASFAENGDVTEDQWKAIHRVYPGLSRKMAKAVAEGMAAQHVLRQHTISTFKSQAEEIAGGSEQLQILNEWIQESVDPDRLKTINSMLAKDPKAYPEYVRLMKIEYEAKVGGGGSRPIIGGGANKGVSGAGAKDAKEFRELMERAKAGDEVARKRMLATPDDKIWEWNNA